MDKLKDTLRIFVVPTEILDMEELDVYEKMTYMVLRSYANGQDDTAFPSYSTIAKKGSMGRKKAIECVKKLEELGLVVKETRQLYKNGKVENTSNLYTIHRPAEIKKASKKGQDKTEILGLHHLVHEQFGGSIPQTPPSVSETPPSISQTPPSVPQTPELKNLKELDKTKNKTSSSSSASRNSIDNELKEKYPSAPFEEVKEQLLNDDTAVITTDKQYKSMLEYRLKNWKPSTAATPKPKQPIQKKPIRTEYLPDWFKDADEYYK